MIMKERDCYFKVLESLRLTLKNENFKDLE